MLSVPHLDREFDYLVSAEQSDDAQPGVRVRVRFHGRLVDAFVLERRSDTDHVGKLGWLDRVVSAERVLTPDVRRLVDAVAARYAGTRADVLRLAVPPRHANVEKEPPAEPARADRRSRSTPAGGPNTARGEQFLAALRGGPRRARGMAGAARGAVDRPAGRGRGGRRSTPGAACWPSCPTSATSTRCTPPACGCVDEGRVVGAVGGARARAALPALAVGAARRRAAGHRHPQRRVRARSPTSAW